MKGGKMVFDEFSLVLLGGIIFLGILVLGFSTPGEFPPTATPSEVTLDLDPGSSATFDINISKRVSGVNVSTSGSIASWIHLSNTNVGATGATGAVVTATVNIPDGATAGRHTGKIVIFSLEGRTQVDVNVDVSAVKRLTSRTLSVEDSKISYSAGTTNIGTHEGTFVSKSYLFEKPLQIVGLVDEERLPILNGGAVRFVIDNANNYGPIIIKQNGNEIFSEIAGPGETIVPLNISDVKTSNTFRIESGAPGLFFWADNLYDIRDVSVDVSYEGPISKTFEFSLTPQEQDKFDHLQLTYVVGEHTIPLPPMKIELNDQTLFFEIPSKTLFNEQLSRDIFGAPINVGERNTMTLSFNEEASYEITSARLTIFSRVR